MLDNAVIETMVELALAEDVGSGDITARLLPKEQATRATIITREAMVCCGRAWCDEVFKQLGGGVTINWLVKEGELVQANQTLCEISGNSQQLLTGERCALNFLQMLSGTATLTHHYVSEINDTNTKLLDTRKTIPGFRLAQKYAVQCGGGSNHRIGLFDAFLIKENHIAACGSITKAVLQARQNHPDKKVEVEVENIAELTEALEAKVDVVMLDNFSIAQIQEAVSLVAGGVKLEVSGNVTLENIREYALTGVDYISVGAITKHIGAVDLSLRLLNLSE